MMKTLLKTFRNFLAVISTLFFLNPAPSSAQIKLEQEVKITDDVMYMDGVRRADNYHANSPNQYDYVYGPELTPHGDCIKAFDKYVFMTWYRGGKLDRHVMLTRYNTETKTLATIEFPHRHTGFNGQWWLGEAHNTIAVGICPKDSTIHMMYDMHRNGNVAAFANDYMRYSYTYDGAATVPDDEFTLERFVNSPAGNYKHLTLDGINDVNTNKMLTYPAFFNNDEGDLFFKIRYGYSKNAKFLFAKFDGNKWKGYTQFNKTGGGSNGLDYNWGLYGDFKYENGKIRIGFQRRSKNPNDKYLYQNGVYYAYSDDPTGESQWKDYKGNPISMPLLDADDVKIAEPGDFVQTTQKNKVRITGGNDFTVTAAGDEHFISHVKDLQYNVTKHLHTYRKAGDAEFTTVEYSAGGSALYSSGNDVYVISTKNGRINIVKTEGGTSNFRQVYQHTTGPTIDKMVVQVYNGKVYCYVKKTGHTKDKCTTYLQIFDLDLKLAPTDTAHALNFKNLTEGQEVELGANLAVEANVGSAYKEVSLWVDSTNIGTLTNAPYTWSSHALLTNMRAPFYQLKLVAIDSADITVEKTVVIYTPEDLTRKVSFINLEDEDEIPYGSDLTIEATVGSAFKEVSLWLGDTNLGTLTSAPYTWSGHALLTNMVDPSYIFRLVAKDSSDVEVEEVVSITVGEQEFVVNVDSLIGNLIFYCPLNEDGRDLSGNENNAVPGSAVTFAPGKFGNAAEFSYTEGSYITTADSIFKYSYPTAYTIAFWLKVSDYSQRGDILQPTVGRPLLYSLGDLSFRCSHQKKVISYSVDEQEKNDWLHVAILLDQRDGQRKHQVYINGEQRGEVAEGYEFDTGKPQAIGKLIFGAFSADELMRNFTGMIDEIYMFNDVLSDDEISFLMNTGNLVALSSSNQSSLYINFEYVSTDN